MDKFALPMLELALTMRHQSPIIPLEEVGETYFNSRIKSFKSVYLSGELKRMGLIAFRCGDSQKSPVFVHTSDLASFLLKKRNVQITDKSDF